MISKSLDLSADIIDVRDIIERVEELKDQFGQFTIEEREELETLRGILDDLKGNGGDEKWEGDWYPVTLIRDSYFTDYAQELCEDIGDIGAIPHYVVIDWDATARNIRADYTSTEIEGVTYWYR